MGIYINDVCDRCKRSVPVPVEEEVMDAKVKEMRQMEEVISKVAAFAEGLEDPLPEVIVLYRQENGHFMVKGLPHLCGPMGDRKRGAQGCKARVEEIVHELFLDVPKAPRVKKEKE